MQAEFVFLVLAWLGTYLLHSTLLLAGVWFLSRRGTLRSPRLAERVWRLAVVGGVLTATLQVGLGARPFLGSFALMSEERSDVTAGEAAPATTSSPFALVLPSRDYAERSSPVERDKPGRRTSPALEHEGTPEVASVPVRTPREPRRSGRAAIVEEDERERTAAAVAGREAPFAGAAEHPTAASLARMAFAPGASPVSVSWKSIVLSVWVFVGGLGLVGFLWAWSRLAARLHDRREITRGPLREKLDELAHDAGVRGRVRLYASATLASPLTYGWLKKRICVPVRALSDLSPGQQASMLAHELAHAKRRDPLWFSVYTLAERLLFFQPLNRTARRELHDLAELLCDDWAVRWTGGRLALASCLTEIAQWIVGARHEHHPALPSSGMAGRPSRLGKRVERLLHERNLESEPHHRWWSPVALTSLAVVAFAAPGVSRTPANSAEIEPEPVALSEPAPGVAPNRPSAEVLRTTEPAGLAPRATPAPAAPATASAPAPARETAPIATAVVAPATLRSLELRLEEVDVELELHAAELAELRALLAGSAHSERFANAFSRVEDGIQTLHRQRERLAALLQRVSKPQ